MALDLSLLATWMDAYGRAWVSNAADEVAALFTEDAVYYVSPFQDPWVGRDAIVQEWVSDPEGQESVRFHHEPLAVTGDVGVARWSVSYVTRIEEPTMVEMDGVLVLRFDPDGRCREHREWYVRQERPLAGGEPTTVVEG
jgi:ketosteroid isomerase-like protein